MFHFSPNKLSIIFTWHVSVRSLSDLDKFRLNIQGKTPEFREGSTPKNRTKIICLFRFFDLNRQTEKNAMRVSVEHFFIVQDSDVDILKL